MDRLIGTKRFLVALSVLALSACGAASSPGAPAPLTASVHRATCSVVLWASTVNSGGVNGFDSGGTNCTTIYGSGTENLTYANGLATGGGYLYVADKVGKIFVFTTSGTLVKVWKTSIGTTTYNPWSVCVTRPPLSPTVIGVGTYQASSSATPVAEFFTAGQANGSGPTGYASGAGLTSQAWCAFDKLGDFFIDGTTAANHQRIAYLARAYVNVSAQTLVDSGLGSAHYWYSMYSRINTSPSETLSVNGRVQCPSGCSEKVYNWNISPHPAHGPLGFVSPTHYTFTGWPSSPSSPIYQLAPSTGGASGYLYMSAFYNNTIYKAPATGGPVGPPWNTAYEKNPIGLATVPTGQY
ncbi:MAG TPA: hypothetical protein VKR56_11650 [Candidatus Cybelea sp.]|nr:hypothetical protein [Candidatus Cybelea sp.]